MCYFTKIDCIEILEQVIFELELDSNFDCIFNLNNNEDGSYCSQIPPLSKITIGCSFLNKYKDNDIVSNIDVVDVVLNIFHEYQHALRNYEMYHNFQQGNEEVYVSSFTSAYFPYYYHKKYKMSPSELDAELNGILKAKLFFEESYPEFNFESAVVERISKLFEDNCWYGPFDYSEIKAVFSYNDVIDYLKSWQNIAYNYNPFPNTLDKNFYKTKEYSLLDTKENGAKHYNDMLSYIKEFATLSYEDEVLVSKLISFSQEKIKLLEDAKDERTVHDDWGTR